MIPAPFEYARPSSVDEAVGALAQGGEDAKVLAGGQSLIPLLRLRMAAPTVLVDLGGIAALRGISEDGDDIVIGSMTTHAEALRDPLVAQYAPLLAKATVTVADPMVRHRATIGGSLAHADPAGDLPAVAVALGATFAITGADGTRLVPAEDFFVDFLTTAIGPAEVLTAVRIPKRAGWGAHYEKFNRMAQAWSLVGVAAVVRRENGSIAEARVALTNMGPTPIRAAGVEAALAGQPATAESIAAAAGQSGQGTSPSADISASAEYRTHLANVLTRRALTAAAGV